LLDEKSDTKIFTHSHIGWNLTLYIACKEACCRETEERLSGITAGCLGQGGRLITISWLSW